MSDPSLLHKDVPLPQRIAAADEQAFRLFFNLYHYWPGTHIYQITLSCALPPFTVRAVRTAWYAWRQKKVENTGEKVITQCRSAAARKIENQQPGKSPLAEWPED